MLRTARGRLLGWLRYARHNRRIAGIRETAPAAADPCGPIYAGMTCHRDVLSWLVAVKSIAHQVGPGGYVAIDDGSLTARDRGLLATHLPGLRVLAGTDIDTEGWPARRDVGAPAGDP